MEVEGCFLRLFTEILFGPLFRYRMRTKTFKNSIEDRFVSDTQAPSIKSSKLHLDQIIEAPSRSNHRSSISIKSSKLHSIKSSKLHRSNIFAASERRPAERAPKPNPPSQPRPRTRRAYHLAHAKGRRIDRRQRPPPRRSSRDACILTHKINLGVRSFNIKVI